VLRSGSEQGFRESWGMLTSGQGAFPPRENSPYLEGIGRARLRREVDFGGRCDGRPDRDLRKGGLSVASSPREKLAAGRKRALTLATVPWARKKFSAVGHSGGSTMARDRQDGKEGRLGSDGRRRRPRTAIFFASGQKKQMAGGRAVFDCQCGTSASVRISKRRPCFADSREGRVEREAEFRRGGKPRRAFTGWASAAARKKKGGRLFTADPGTERGGPQLAAARQ